MTAPMPHRGEPNAAVTSEIDIRIDELRRRYERELPALGALDNHVRDKHTRRHLADAAEQHGQVVRALLCEIERLLRGQLACYLHACEPEEGGWRN